MDAKDVRLLQDAVKARLDEIGVETAYLDGEEGQIGDTLRALLPVTEAGDCVLMEILVSPFDESAELLQFYTTLIMEIGPGYEALKELLLDWNLFCPLGAFGIYRQGRQFFHRYTLPLPRTLPPEAMTDSVYYLADRIHAVISERFPDAVRISGHT